MKYTYEYYLEELKKSENRMKELKKMGAKALSSYDINIANSGDKKLALWTAKYLIGNHIKYFKQQLAKMHPMPIQQPLF